MLLPGHQAHCVIIIGSWLDNESHRVLNTDCLMDIGMDKNLQFRYPYSNILPFAKNNIILMFRQKIV